MIIGNGLISSVFLNSDENYDKYIIFASGVSNSKETDSEKFAREKNLLSTVIKNNENNLKLIYFSSILSGIVDLPYYNHKLDMENFIIKNSENYIIYRMPQIVGNNGNSNNLVNYIKNSIEKKEKIFIYEKAMRAILDVEDLKKIVDGSIEQIINEVINISFVEKVNVRNLCKKIGKILKINPIVETIEPINSVNWDIENSGIVEDVIKKIKIENKNYTYKVLTKYIKK
jgi:hypothetical protein